MKMALKLAKEIKDDKFEKAKKLSFSKILYNLFKLNTKSIPFEQYLRLHMDSSNIAICETASDIVVIFGSTSFSQDVYCF